MQPHERGRSGLSPTKLDLNCGDGEKSFTLQSPPLKCDFLLNSSIILQLRKSQLDQLLEFLKSNCKRAEKNSCRIALNIGPPGVGKTSLIKQALDMFRLSLLKCTTSFQERHTLKIICFNGHSMSKCREITRQLRAQESIHTKLNTQRTQPNEGLGMLINVVLIEEIENLIGANDPESLKQFLCIFTEAGSDRLVGGNQQRKQKYVLVGTSNTINLELVLGKKIGNAKILTILYPPYSVESLIKIAQGRIENVKKELNISLQIPERLLKFVIMKLQENKKDDTRNLIEIIKDLLLFVENRKDIKQSLQKGKIGLAQLSLEDINRIPKIKSLLNPSKVSLVEKLSLKQQLVLALIYAHIKTKDSIQISEVELVDQFKKTQKGLGITAYEDVRIAINELDTYGCIKVVSSKKVGKGNKNQPLRCIILKISLQDVETVISGNPVLSHYISSTRPPQTETE